MLAAVVILYHPNPTILSNIASYIDGVDQLYVIDNSDAPNSDLFDTTSFKHKINYVFNDGNLGIAKALNIGCEMAIAEGMDWILTMDQDSSFSQINFKAVAQTLKTAPKKTALFYPNYTITGVPYDRCIKEDNQPIIVMSSGNIISLAIYKKIGGFDDKLFIDYVDVDYCLKIKKMGYHLLNLPRLHLEHELGDSKHLSFLSLKAIVTNHSSLRRYYITRNRLYVKEKYKDISPIFCQNEARSFFNELIKIVLFEDRKLSKFNSIIKGYRDYRNSKYGKYES